MCLLIRNEHTTDGTFLTLPAKQISYRQQKRRNSMCHEDRRSRRRRKLENYLFRYFSTYIRKDLVPAALNTLEIGNHATQLKSNIHQLLGNVRDRSSPFAFVNTFLQSRILLQGKWKNLASYIHTTISQDKSYFYSCNESKTRTKIWTIGLRNLKNTDFACQVYDFFVI